MPAISYETETYLGSASASIQGSHFGYARKLRYAESWNQIRLGILLSAVPYFDSTVGNFLSHFVALGVCSGTTYPVWSTECANFFGYFPPTMTYTQNAGIAAQKWLNYAGPGYDQAVCKKRLTTTTTASVGAFPISHGQQVVGNFRRGLFFITITRGAPNFTMKLHVYTGGQAATVDWTAAHLIQGLSAASPFTLNGVLFSASADVALAMDESTGVLDSVCWWINSPEFAMHVCEFGAYKLS